MVYGFDVLEGGNPHVLLAEEMDMPSSHLLHWFPGTSFQKRADYYRAKITEMITKPWEEVREKLITGETNPDSFCVINMHKFNNGVSKHTETLITATATAMYGGASDTTASAAWPFMLNSCGRASLSASPPDRPRDRRGRLPRMSDHTDMPYLMQIVWEVFRWAPPVPFTKPSLVEYHSKKRPAEYRTYIRETRTSYLSTRLFQGILLEIGLRSLPQRNWLPSVTIGTRELRASHGYILSRDTTMVTSLYSITHDIEFHVDPKAFDLDRYTDGKKRMPYYVFGYGHCRCPDADMAFAQLFHQASKPEPFGYEIKPWYKGVEALFQDALPIEA
ncbi:hypothetical protein FB451DRAFT_1377791 [Mycena latifolia]|nr:hypothetical protein FB451DRAFT_1377791 [Mycena latifolia]